MLAGCNFAVVLILFFLRSGCDDCMHAADSTLSFQTMLPYLNRKHHVCYRNHLEVATLLSGVFDASRVCEWQYEQL